MEKYGVSKHRIKTVIVSRDKQFDRRFWNVSQYEVS